MSYTEISSVAVRKVRKNRACAWCAGTIFAGEPAQRRVYVFDGFQSDYMHPICKDALANSNSEYLLDGWMPGDFEKGQTAE